MITPEMKTLLGNAIKNERCALGISQEELAARSGLHRTYISDVERGTRNPSIESVQRLAGALQMSVSALFDRSCNGNSTRLVDVLLVEDNPRDVELTKYAFEKANMTNPLHVVNDGAAALEFVFRTGAFANRLNAQRPLIILLDLNLPKKSGLDVLREIKGDERTRDIPVIVVTASSRDRDMAECRRLGVEDYLVKPVRFQNLSEVTPRLKLGWTLVQPESARARAA